MSAQQINDMIKEEFGILLMTCPECGGIVSSYDLENDPLQPHGGYRCNHCGAKDECCNFPDLFYDD